MNNTSIFSPGPLTPPSSAPRILHSRSQSLQLLTGLSFRDTTGDKQQHGHANNKVASSGREAKAKEWNSDTALNTGSPRSSSRSTTTDNYLESLEASRRSSTTTHNDDNGWQYLSRPIQSPEPPRKHIREETEDNDKKAKEIEEMEESEGQQKVEDKQAAGKEQAIADDMIGVKIERGKENSQVGLPEAESQSLTPKLLPIESSNSQPQSPRLRIQTMQQQIVAGVLNFEPLKNPIESGLDDWSDDDEVDPERLEKEKRKLKSFRVKLVSFRTELRAKNKELKVKESAKVAADNFFMKFVRENIAGPLTLLKDSETFRQNLDHSFQAMQAARDDYGPLEDEYNELFEKLESAEFELARMERRVYSRKVSNSTDPKPTTTSEHSSPNTDSVFGSVWSEQEPYDPLHFEYLSRLGDLDLALEKLAYMDEEFDALTTDQETKARVGVEFDQDLKAYIEGLPSMQARLESEIANIQIDVERLRGQCLNAGIELELPDIETSTSNTISEENKPIDDGNILQEIQRPHVPAENCMFTLLFPFPDTEKLCSLQHLITKFDENNKSDRINRWLLYSLRTSKLDAFRFAQYYLDFFAFSNCQADTTAQWELQWQQSILSTWTTDGANTSPDAFGHGFTQSCHSFSILPVTDGNKLSLDSPKQRGPHEVIPERG